MAQIVKKQVTEIGLEGLITILKRNWRLLACYFSYCLSVEKGTVKVSAFFNLFSINEELGRAEGLVAEANELRAPIVDILREIEHQTPHFKNMNIGGATSSSCYDDLTVSFTINIAVVPVMPIDPLDIPGPDNPMDPDPTNRFSKPAPPPTLAMLEDGGNPDKVHDVEAGSILDNLGPTDSEFIIPC